MGDKTMLMSIGQIADAIGVTRRMILNYEDRGLIRPDRKEGESGNRYYTVDTLTRVKTIRILQDVGLSLAEIRAYYDDNTDLAPMLKRLERMRDELNQSIEKLRERINGGESAEIRYTVLPRQTQYCCTIRSESIAQRTILLRETCCAAMQRYGTDRGKRLLSVEYPLDDPDEITYCIAIPEESTGEGVVSLPEVSALTIIFHGAYEAIPTVRERLIAYARERGIKPLGTCRHIYLEGPPQHKDPKKFITQVALPIADWRRGTSIT